MRKGITQPKPGGKDLLFTPKKVLNIYVWHQVATVSVRTGSVPDWLGYDDRSGARILLSEALVVTPEG